jgi:hypothetical protein
LLSDCYLGTNIYEGEDKRRDKNEETEITKAISKGTGD